MALAESELTKTRVARANGNGGISELQFGAEAVLPAAQALEPSVGASDSGAARAPRTWSLAALAVDGLMLAVAVAAAAIIARLFGTSSGPILWSVAFGLLAFGLLYKRGLYRWRVRLQILDDVKGILTVTVLAITSVLSLRVLVGGVDDLAGQSVRLWLCAAVCLVAGRLALQWTRAETRRDGTAARRTLIIGAGRIGHLVANRLLEHPEFGLRPVGFLDKEPLDDPRSPVPVLGASWDLENAIRDNGIEHVVVAFSTAPSEVMLRQVQRCEAAGVGVSVVPRLFEYMTERLTIEHIGGLPLVSARRAGPNGWQFAVKYALDRLVAAMLLLITLPLLAIIALGVLLTTGRPILFRQTRVGLRGRKFEILKFRTMTGAAGGTAQLDQVLNGNTAPGGVESGVDRRTRFGSFIRRWSLDELPQLVNVFKGEMSLIGPRPERPHFVELFEQTVPRYADRHRVRPGITGWAQVNGLRGKTSLSDRVEWDNYYVENWSIWLDFKILLMTFFVVGKHSAQVE